MKAIFLIPVILLLFNINSFSQDKYCYDIPKGSKLKVNKEILIPANTGSVALKEIKFYSTSYDNIYKEYRKVEYTVNTTFIPIGSGESRFELFSNNLKGVDYDRTVKIGRVFTINNVEKELSISGCDFSLTCDDGSIFKFRFFGAVYNNDGSFAYSSTSGKLDIYDFITNLNIILSITLDNSKAVDY